MEFNFYEKCAWIAGFISFNGWRHICMYNRNGFGYEGVRKTFRIYFCFKWKICWNFRRENGDKPAKMKILTGSI